MLVLEAGLDAGYVMDQMQMYEVDTLINNLYKANKNGWEQARMIAYLLAQVNSSKKLKPTDIISFSWDKEQNKGDTKISNEDIERLRDEAKQFINKI